MERVNLTASLRITIFNPIGFFMRFNTCVSRRLLFTGVFFGALIAWAPLSNCMAQDSSVSDDGGVVVRKNADGSIDTFDVADPAAPGNSSSSSSSAPAATTGAAAGKPIYGVHGAGKPYTRKHGDGVVVRRNADGSIETFDTTSSPTPLYGSGSPARRTRKKSTRRRRASKRAVKPVKKSGSKAKKTK